MPPRTFWNLKRRELVAELLGDRTRTVAQVAAMLTRRWGETVTTKAVKVVITRLGLPRGRPGRKIRPQPIAPKALAK
jgi:hypothetical protein